MVLTQLVRVALLFACYALLMLMIAFDGVGSLFAEDTTT